MKIMKLLEFHIRIRNNHENLIFPRQNHKNYGIPRNPFQNNENHENNNYSMPESEFHARTRKKLKM